MDKHLTNPNEGIPNTDMNRVSTLTDRRNFDALWHRVLRKAGSSAQFGDGEPGYFPGTNCQVAIGTGGDKSTGVGMKIQVGVGFKKLSTVEQSDDQLPQFTPIVVATELAFTTANSDGALPRMDHVYMKPASADTDSNTVNIIDPDPPNNITQESRDKRRTYSNAYAYAPGTPDAGAAGGTGAPGPPGGYVAADLIATILVLAGSGSLDPGEITDSRVLFEVDIALIAGVTSLDADAIVVSPTVFGDADVQAALTSAAAQIAASVPSGIISGKLEYVDTTSVKIARGLDGKIRAAIDGVMIEKADADLTFILDDFGVGGSHLDTGSEAVSTMYYLYLQDVASSFSLHISATGPVVDPTLKVGYHPTSTTWLCVGSFFNDDSENVVPFHTSGQWHLFNDAVVDHTFDMGTTTAVAWTAAALKIAVGATAVKMMIAFEMDDVVLCFGASDAPGTLPVDNDYTLPTDLDEAMIRGVLAMVTSGQGTSVTDILDSAEIELPIADPSAPAIRWGAFEINATQSITEAMWKVLGYEDPFQPRR